MLNSTRFTAMLIDDDIISLGFLNDVLKDICEIIPVSSEAEALDKLRDFNIGVIIHGSKFPPKPGRLPQPIKPEFMQFIKQEYPLVPNVVYHGGAESPKRNHVLLKFIATPEEIRKVIVQALQSNLIEESILVTDKILKQPSSKAERENLDTLALNIEQLWQLNHLVENRNFAGVLVMLKIACKLATKEPLKPAQYEAIRQVLEAIRPIEIDEEVKLTCGEWLLESGINLYAPMDIQSELVWNLDRD